MWKAVAAAAVVTLTTACGASEPVDGSIHSSDEVEFALETVAADLEFPWGMAFLPDGDILVTEKPGRLRIVRDGTLDPTPIAGVPQVFYEHQGGLLDVALHPEFAENGLVYLSYSKPVDGGATTAVVRGRLDGNELQAVEEIIEADARAEGGRHFGSRLVFDGDGYLYVTVGERGEMEEAQNLANHQGTTLRLHDDGSVPRDNPFVDRDDARPEIFTWGNRSPQGLTVHPETGELWGSEHGPRGGDEVNILRAGRNYGWPLVTHGINYNGDPISDRQEMDGVEAPIHYWDPSIATSGIAIYDGDRFPAWRGNVFVGGLAGRQLVRLELENGTVTAEETLLEDLGRIRDVRSGPDGYLYLLTDAGDGQLIRLVPVN